MLNKPYKYIETMHDLLSIVPILMVEEALGCDTETTGLDPLMDKVRLIQIATEREVFVIDVFRVGDVSCLKEIFETRAILKIFQNAKFDVKFLKTNFGFSVKRIFDTMLAGRLISNGRVALMRANGLDDLCERYLGIMLPKEMQRSDWSVLELSEQQIEYAANDVGILHPLMDELIKALRDNALIGCAKIEFECCLATAWMELNGIYVDVQKWQEYVSELEGEHARLLTALKDVLKKPNINLSSPIQVKNALADIGIVVTSTGEPELQVIAKTYPAVALLLEFRGVEKMLSSYGNGVPGKKRKKGQVYFLERINPVTGRIHPDFWQLLPETGRFSCGNPNMQQVVGTQKAGFRWAIVGDRGLNKLIVADYSQIELRILAEYSKDPAFIKAFNSGEDLHKFTASMMYNVPLDQVTKIMRTAAKSINFGLAYGRGARSLAAQIGVTYEEALAAIAAYSKMFAGVWEWLKNSGRKTVREHQCRTMSGRVRYFEFDQASGKERSSVEREGKNTPIQGTSADIIKVAMAMCHREFEDTSIKMVNMVHDELVFDVPPELAESAAIRIKEIMEEAGRVFIKSVPIICETGVCDAWAEK